MTLDAIDVNLIHRYPAVVNERRELAAMASAELRQARTALQLERKRLKDELARVEQAIGALNGVINVPVPTSRKRSGGVKEAVIAVLQEKGSAMHADDIVEAVRARGVQMSSADPKATVVTVLLRLRDTGDVLGLGRNNFRWNELPVIQPTIGDVGDDEEEIDLE